MSARCKMCRDVYDDGIAEHAGYCSDICKLASDADRLRAVNAELLAALRALTDAVVPHVNEHGAGGFLLARIHDARAAIARAEGETKNPAE